MLFTVRLLFIISSIILLIASQPYTVKKSRVDRPIPYTLQYYLIDTASK